MNADLARRPSAPAGMRYSTRSRISVRSGPVSSKVCVCLHERLVRLPRGVDRLLEVGDGRPVTTLGCVPDELPDEGCRLGFDGAERAASALSGGMLPEEGDLSMKSASVGQDRRGGLCVVVPGQSVQLML